MLELARRLEQASAQRDWAALGRADAELVAQLPSWGDPGGWTAFERRALDVLRRVQEQAAERCRAEARGMGERIAEIMSARGRWQAYAQSSNWEGGR